MFAKPINLILVYIVTVFNVAILSSPLIAILIPFINRHHPTLLVISDDLLQKLKLAAFILIFLVSFFMLIYMMLDFLLGFAITSSLKDCTRYDKLKDFDFLKNIFTEAREVFNEKSVKLYIKKSEEINAFAVSSLGGKAIVLTEGMIHHYLAESKNPQEFLLALRSIIGHEMSHLINKDFLPTYLMIANQKATNFVSRIVNIIFNASAYATSYIPYTGKVTARLMLEANNILYFAINFFNRHIVQNIYEFLRRFVSRNIEYRCDRQSGEAFGGKNMAFALSFLGKSGYITIFSTHPRTQKRIAKVLEVEATERIIKPKFADAVANYFAIMFLIIACIYFAKQAHIDLFIREYISNHAALNRKLGGLWHLISRWF